MTLTIQVAEHVRACFAGIWIQSYEHEDALVEIARLCSNEGWKLATWDIDQGLSVGPGSTSSTGDSAGTDPLAAVRAIRSFAADDTAALVVLTNFHRFLNSAEIMQAVTRQVTAGKHNRTILVVLSPVVQIPVELEKLFVVLEHPLPTREQLQEIALGIATEDDELLDASELSSVLDSAAGLTRLEAENAFSLSIVRHDRLESSTVRELKAGMLKKSGLLRLYHGTEDFDALGGLNSLKAFCRRSLMQPVRDNPLKQPRGVLLLGVPGTGKSAFAKALGKETGRPTLVLDIGTLMGSLVGETESNVRRALQIADVMSPCILFVDELEKAVSGASSGKSDSGVSSRLLGTLLSWLSDHESDVYLIATCNDISRLPPELTRAERLDGIMFLDLPGREQKDLIWAQYLRLFDLDVDQDRPADEDWTGAEVRSCCRLSALLDIPLTHAALNVVPVAVTANETINNLRSWASGRCLDAEHGGIYQFASPKGRSRRKVSRGPLMN
jgi:hypothetical protein